MRSRVDFRAGEPHNHEALAAPDLEVDLDRDHGRFFLNFSRDLLRSWVSSTCSALAPKIFQTPEAAIIVSKTNPPSSQVAATRFVYHSGAGEAAVYYPFSRLHVTSP